MNLADADKITVLLNRLDFHTNEIQRRQDNEMKLFEWSTALLLAVFAVILALSDRAAPLSYPLLAKSIATLLIAFPTAVFSYRILSEKPGMKRQAEIIEKIEQELRLFDEDQYISKAALYPEQWQGNLAASMLKRKTPLYYVLIMAFMTLCVIATVWLVL